MTERRHLRDCTARSRQTQEFVPFGEKVLARQITIEPRNRINPRYQYGVWLGMRNNSAECFIGTQMVCSELVKFGDWSLRTDGKQKPSTV